MLIFFTPYITTGAKFFHTIVACQADQTNKKYGNNTLCRIKSNAYRWLAHNFIFRHRTCNYHCIKANLKKGGSIMRQTIIILTLSFFAIIIGSVNAFSEQITLDGTIQGASCVINNTYCPEDSSDPHIALEKTFVLVDEDKNYYFLSNISKIAKMSLLNKNIQVTAKKQGKALYVKSVSVIGNNNRTAKVWDWEEVKDSLSRPSH